MAKSGVRGFSAAHLRRRRAAKDLTQSELASAVQVSPRVVQQWEAGEHTPDLAAARRLADVLGCTLADLIDLKPDDVRLADLRIRAGLHQAEAARVLGWSVPTLRAIETAERAASAKQRTALTELYEISGRQFDAAAECTNGYRETAIRGKVNPPT